MLRDHLGQTSGLGDYEDFKEKKERITSGQKLKEKTYQALPILCSYKMNSHIEEVYTSKYFNLSWAFNSNYLLIKIKFNIFKSIW